MIKLCNDKNIDQLLSELKEYVSMMLRLCLMKTFEPLFLTSVISLVSKVCLRG